MKKKFFNLLSFAYLIVFLLIGTLSYYLYTSSLPFHVLSLTPQLAVICIGLTIIMICGEIDLSIGSLYFLGPALLWSLWKAIHIPEIAFILTLAICCLIGFMNGFIVTKFKIPSMIVTLGMLYVLRYFVIFVTRGIPAVLSKASFSSLHAIFTESSIVPHQLLWTIFFAAIFWILLNRTRFGNWIFFTGGNERAAIDCGINTNRVKKICFIICSLLAGWGGIMGSLRIGLVDPVPNELDVLLACIAGVVIGGTSIFGGKGSILGSLLGIICMKLLQSVLGAIGIGSWYKILLGIIIVIIMIGQALGRFQRERGT